MGYCFAFSGACPEALSSRAEAVRCLEILLWSVDIHREAMMVAARCQLAA